MISILIPTYNDICVDLVESLHEQGEKLGVDYEILLADDASPREEVRRANRTITRWSCCRYLQQEVNSGLSHMRNLLIREARYDYLLLMDSDVEVISPDYLKRYVEDAPKADVVCGAWANPQTPPERGYELRRYYEWHAEPRRTAAWRTAHPWDSFGAFNTLFHRSVFNQVQFDENIKQYGYEDALIGLEMSKLNFTVLHTDNALLHIGADTNEKFLLKTETALRTLHNLSLEMRESAQVSHLALRLQRLGLRPLVAGLFRALRPMLRRNLCSRRPNLKLFAFYKLGYYAELG